MKIFVRFVAIAVVCVALLAWWSGAAVRGTLLALLAVGLWIAASRPVRHPGLLVAGAIAAALILVGNLVGPFALIIFDAVDAH